MKDPFIGTYLLSIDYGTINALQLLHNRVNTTLQISRFLYRALSRISVLLRNRFSIDMSKSIYRREELKFCIDASSENGKKKESNKHREILRSQRYNAFIVSWLMFDQTT